jgi:hypothetical protein
MMGELAVACTFAYKNCPRQLLVPLSVLRIPFSLILNCLGVALSSEEETALADRRTSIWTRAHMSIAV